MARAKSRLRSALATSLLVCGLLGGSGSAAATQAAVQDFYVDPRSNAAEWVAAHPNDPRADAIDSAIADVPGAKWFGDWNADPAAAVASYMDGAAGAGATPVIVAYDMYQRDCSGASGGGAADPQSYRNWISAFASGIGDREAIVIVEPDALAQLDCLPDDGARATRLELLRHAVETLQQQAPRARSYLDAGNPTWITPDAMADRLNQVGVGAARGFSLNVSNYHTTADNAAYGDRLNAALQQKFGYRKQFVVDTSRNGNGANGEWCNPAGRKLGAPPSEGTGTGPEALLWIKNAGDSDGPCGIGQDIPAGQFDPELAMHLINGG